jgi:hypothetical protein
METSLTATAEFTRKASVTKLSARGAHQRYDDTSSLTSARASVEFTARREGLQFPLQIVVEKRDALIPPTDPRRNKDALRAGASVSAVGKFSPTWGEKAKYGGAYIYTVQYARGSDEDYNSHQAAISLSEIRLTDSGSLALEKLEGAYEKREGDNPHSRISTGGTRDDSTLKAALTLRYVTSSQLKPVGTDGSKARYKWKASISRTVQDSTVYVSDFNGTTFLVMFSGIF